MNVAANRTSMTPAQDSRTGDRPHGAADAFARVLETKAAALRDAGGEAVSRAPLLRPMAALLLLTEGDEKAESPLPDAATCTPPMPLRGLESEPETESPATEAPACATAPTAPADASPEAPPLATPSLPPATESASLRAFEAAFNSTVAAILPTADAQAPSTWEASLAGTFGVAIEMRAERVLGANGVAATWTLTLASPSVDAGLLARHAPRLDERLRRRALADTPVRIEHADEDDA